MHEHDTRAPPEDADGDGGGDGDGDGVQPEAASPQQPPRSVGPAAPAAINPDVIAFVPTSLKLKRKEAPKAQPLLKRAPGPRRPAHASVPIVVSSERATTVYVAPDAARVGGDAAVPDFAAFMSEVAALGAFEDDGKGAAK